MPELSISADRFLAALDKQPRVTRGHPAIERGEFKDEPIPTTSCCGSRVPHCPPELVDDDQHYLSARSLRMWLPLLIGNVRMTIQLARPFLIAAFALLPLAARWLVAASAMTPIAQGKVCDPSLPPVPGCVPASSGFTTPSPSNPYSPFSRGQALELALVSFFLAHGLLFDVASVLVALFLLSTVRDDLMLQRACCGRRTRVYEGLYHAGSSKVMRILAQAPMISGAAPYESTSWMWSGDLRTALPFMLYTNPLVHYDRRFVEMDDHEAVAVDIAMPDHGYDPSKPIVVVLHGLNGGSKEPYVLDLVHEALGEGFVVAVMVARGLMGTPIVNGRVFTGARISDLHTVVETLRGAGSTSLAPAFASTTPSSPSSSSSAAAAKSLSAAKGATSSSFSGVVPAPQFTPRVAILGFSMGGIIAANYATKMGADAGVIATVAFSGSADTKQNIPFMQSRRVWQPFLTFALKQNLIVPMQYLLKRPGVSKKPIDIRHLEGVNDIAEFDESFVVRIGGYESLSDYYDDISCGVLGKMQQLATPLLLVHAEDDPILTVDSYECVIQDLERHPINLRKRTSSFDDAESPCTTNSPSSPSTSSGNPNLIVAITRHGGHVGWPTGFNAVKTKWGWMSKAGLQFIKACDAVWVADETARIAAGAANGDAAPAPPTSTAASPAGPKGSAKGKSNGRSSAAAAPSAEVGNEEELESKREVMVPSPARARASKRRALMLAASGGAV